MQGRMKKYLMVSTALIAGGVGFGLFISQMAAAGNTPEDKQLAYYGGVSHPVAITEVLDTIRNHPEQVVRVHRQIAKGAPFAERVAVDGTVKSVWSIMTASDDEELKKAVETVNDRASANKLPIENETLKGSDGDVSYRSQGPAGETGWRYWGPKLVEGAVWVALIGGGFLLFRKASGNMPIPGQSEKSPLEVMPDNGITLDDVEGIDEIKQSLRDWIHDIKDRSEIARLGGQPSKARLFVGPPGTGKTMAARAIANESGLTCLFMSGSPVEKFVGVGAARVKAAFAHARKIRSEKGACIIVVDEIEGLLKSRANSEGSNDETSRTVGTWLAEMDGLHDNDGLFFIGMTNQPELMDPAAVRPGRFDPKVEFPYPDADGREKILKVHAKGVPLAEDVDLHEIAHSLPGKTTGSTIREMLKDRAPVMARRLARRGGAEAKSVTREALLRVAEEIEFGAPIDEARSSRLPESFKDVVRKHETGHLITALVLEELSEGPGKMWGHPVKIISAMGPAGTGGFVKTGIGDDVSLMSETELRAWMVIAFGGTTAEKLFIGTRTVGNQNDLEQLNKAADQMVTMFGMSPNDELPAVVVPRHGGSRFLGGGGNPHYDGLSDESMTQIDAGKAKLIRDAEAKARAILLHYKGFFDYFHPELAKASGMRMYAKDIYEHWRLWNAGSRIEKPEWLTNRELWESYWDYRCPQAPTLADLKALEQQSSAQQFPALAGLPRPSNKA